MVSRHNGGAAPLPIPGSIRQSESGQCSNSVGALNSAVPALNFTLPTFTPPFHLAPEACFTAPPMVTALTPLGLGAMALVMAFAAYVMRRERFAAVEID